MPTTSSVKSTGDGAGGCGSSSATASQSSAGLAFHDSATTVAVFFWVVSAELHMLSTMLRATSRRFLTTPLFSLGTLVLILEIANLWASVFVYTSAVWFSHNHENRDERQRHENGLTGWVLMVLIAGLFALLYVAIHRVVQAVKTARGQAMYREWLSRTFKTFAGVLLFQVILAIYAISASDADCDLNQLRYPFAAIALSRVNDTEASLRICESQEAFLRVANASAYHTYVGVFWDDRTALEQAEFCQQRNGSAALAAPGAGAICGYGTWQQACRAVALSLVQEVTYTGVQNILGGLLVLHVATIHLFGTGRIAGMDDYAALYRSREGTAILVALISGCVVVLLGAYFLSQMLLLTPHLFTSPTRIIAPICSPGTACYKAVFWCYVVANVLLMIALICDWQIRRLGTSANLLTEDEVSLLKQMMRKQSLDSLTVDGGLKFTSSQKEYEVGGIANAAQPIHELMQVDEAALQAGMARGLDAMEEEIRALPQRRPTDHLAADNETVEEHLRRARAKEAQMMASAEATTARLEPKHVIALELYTSDAYNQINQPFRRTAQHPMGYPHPLPVTTYCVLEGIQKLRKLPAATASASVGSSGGGSGGSGGSGGGGGSGGLTLWRGMCDVQVKEKFFERGGTERAMMSTSQSLEKAAGFALKKASRETPCLLLKLRAKNAFTQGVSLEFLTRFEGEKEFLYPPCTYLQTTQRTQRLLHEGIHLMVVEVEPQHPLTLA